MTDHSKTHAYVMSSIADMMSGLMMVFLFIAVVFMLAQQKTVKDIRAERDQIELQKEEIAAQKYSMATIAKMAEQKRDQIELQKEEIAAQKDSMAAIAKMAEQNRDKLHSALNVEFRKNFSDWNVQLLEDNTVRFNAPEVLFQTGQTDLTDKYKKILDDFFPRYVQVLYKNREDIDAIRIEGHTSSEWGGQDGFMNNMKLSQERAFKTLQYGYAKVSNIDSDLLWWLHTVLGAQGFSFGRKIVVGGQEDREHSRRVDFKVVTKAEEKLYQILKQEKSLVTVKLKE
ncbi:OmpA-like domain-containing protein [Gammaproteobacteria bacterium]